MHTPPPLRQNAVPITGGRMLTTISGRRPADHLAGDRSDKKSVTSFEFCRHQLNGINGLSYMHTPPPSFAGCSIRTLQFSRRKPSNSASVKPVLNTHSKQNEPLTPVFDFHDSCVSRSPLPTPDSRLPTPRWRLPDSPAIYSSQASGG